MDTDGSGTVSLKELIEFLRAVSGDVDAREVIYLQPIRFLLFFLTCPP
jgi:hypothetical protein